MTPLLRSSPLAILLSRTVLALSLICATIGAAAANAGAAARHSACMASATAARSAAQRMNLSEIKKGDYSSIQGTWKSTSGVEISVSGNQMKIHVNSVGNIGLRGVRVVQTDFAHSANFGGYRATTQMIPGQLLFYPGTLPHLFYLVFAPQGTSIKDWSGYTVPSKVAKPRIYIDGDPGTHAIRNDGANHESSVMYKRGAGRGRRAVRRSFSRMFGPALPPRHERVEEWDDP